MDLKKIMVVGTVVMKIAAWVSTGAVTATAIKKTGNLKAGWIMVIPLLTDWSFKSSPPDKKTEQA